MLRLRSFASFLPWALVACTESADTTDDTDVSVDTDTDAADTDDTDAASGTFTVSVTVSGLEGEGLEIELDPGDDLEIDDDGDFTFEATLEDGEEFEVTIKNQPGCPLQACRVSDGEGTIEGANVTGIRVRCGDPNLTMVTASWGDELVRFTEDVLDLDGTESAVPRTFGGPLSGITNLELDSFTVDTKRDLLYVSTASEILVFEDASTLEGDAAPARVFYVKSGSDLLGIAVDPASDRLYVGSETGLWLFEAASTLEDLVSASLVVEEFNMNFLHLDEEGRLWVSGNRNGEIYVFEDASSINARSTPDRTVSWFVGRAGFNGPTSLWVDTCEDELFISSNAADLDDNYAFVLADASTLDGEVDLQKTAKASFRSQQAITVAGDGTRRLHVFEDSATQDDIYERADRWTGVIEVEPDVSIPGVVNRGYGMEFLLVEE